MLVPKASAYGAMLQQISPEITFARDCTRGSKELAEYGGANGVFSWSFAATLVGFSRLGKLRLGQLLSRIVTGALRSCRS